MDRRPPTNPAAVYSNPFTSNGPPEPSPPPPLTPHREPSPEPPRHPPTRLSSSLPSTLLPLQSSRLKPPALMRNLDDYSKWWTLEQFGYEFKGLHSDQMYEFYTSIAGFTVSSSLSFSFSLSRTDYSHLEDI